MKQQRRIPVRDENDLHSILQKDGIDVKQFGAGGVGVWSQLRALRMEEWKQFKTCFFSGLVNVGIIT